MTLGQPNEERIKLAALHKHWITADSIDHHLRRSTQSKTAQDMRLPKGIGDLAQQLSVFAAISVWYGLLQVVVEGYLALGYHDQTIDALLAQDEHATAFRRFRNATFHYQPDPFSTKLLEFIVAADSETWVHQLNQAFRSFFELRLDIKAVVKSFQDSPDLEETETKDERR